MKKIVVVVLVFASGVSCADAQTAQQKRACTPDVFRLCKRFIPRRVAITKCLFAAKDSLSPACHAVLYGE